LQTPFDDHCTLKTQPQKVFKKTNILKRI